MTTRGVRRNEPSWPPATSPIDPAEAAKDDSASMEVEIELDDVLSESATSQQPLDAEAIPYEISFGAPGRR